MKRKRFELRGRASVLWAALAFVALQLGLAALIESGAVTVYSDTTYSYRTAHLRARLREHSEKPFTVVMLGSSRVMNGFKGGDLEPALSRQLRRPALVYNFGVPGGGTMYSYCCLKRLVAEGDRPDLVLLEVVPAYLTSHSPLEAKWFVFNETKSRKFAGAGDDIGAREVLRAWWEKLVPWHTHRFYILNQTAPELLPLELRAEWVRDADRSGWVVHKAPARTAENIAFTRKLFAPQFEGFRLGGPSCEALEKALALCRRERIAAAIVLLPEGSEFRSWRSADVQFKIDAYLERLSREYGAPLVCAGDWVADEHFSDANHMFASGAAIFTERLGREELPRLVQTAIAAAPDVAKNDRR
jgi:hypothetical protein